ncbi:hypothetical protein D3C71_1249570 [compost metagenome]
MIEALGIGGVEITARANAAGHRQHRHLTALLPAASAGNEGMPEATDLFVVVAPARVMAADGADLDQAERRRCTRVGIAVVLAADEGVDLALQRRRRGLQQRRERQRQQARQARQRAAHGGKQGSGRHTAHELDPVGRCRYGERVARPKPGR